jgi:hypothetical protein
LAFQDVINNSGKGQSGTITTANGTVDHTITSTVVTATRPNSSQGAQMPGNRTGTFEVAFDEPVVGVTVRFDRSDQPEVHGITINGLEVNIQDLINSGDATFTIFIAGSSPVQTGTHIISNGGVTSTAFVGERNLSQVVSDHSPGALPATNVKATQAAEGLKTRPLSHHQG